MTSTRAALIYQHADRESERAIAAGLSETIQAVLAVSNGHGAGTVASERLTARRVERRPGAS